MKIEIEVSPHSQDDGGTGGDNYQVCVTINGIKKSVVGDLTFSEVQAYAKGFQAGIKLNDDTNIPIPITYNL